MISENIQGKAATGNKVLNPPTNHHNIQTSYGSHVTQSPPIIQPSLYTFSSITKEMENIERTELMDQIQIFSENAQIQRENAQTIKENVFINNPIICLNSAITYSLSVLLSLLLLKAILTKILN